MSYFAFGLLPFLYDYFVCDWCVFACVCSVRVRVLLMYFILTSAVNGSGLWLAQFNKQ